MDGPVAVFGSPRRSFTLTGASFLRTHRDRGILPVNPHNLEQEIEVFIADAIASPQSLAQRVDLRLRDRKRGHAQQRVTELRHNSRSACTRGWSRPPKSSPDANSVPHEREMTLGSLSAERKPSSDRDPSVAR